MESYKVGARKLFGKEAGTDDLMKFAVDEDRMRAVDPSVIKDSLMTDSNANPLSCF